MKKWLLGIVVLLIVLLIASAFVFIPNNLTVSGTVLVNSTTETIQRTLDDENAWKKWWPGYTDQVSKDAGFTCNEFRFALARKTYKAFEIDVIRDGHAFPTQLRLLQITPDSVAVRWETTIKSSLNPVKRFQQYERCIELKHCMDHVLLILIDFMGDTRNLYGIDIRRTTLTDSVLVSTRITSVDYPGTDVIYSLIAELKNYIKSHGAGTTNHPMLNVTRNADSTYSTMVGIPTDKELPGNGKILSKRLRQFPDKVLFTEVKGGQESIDKAFNAIDTFMLENHLASPVIPFQLLVTDRSMVKDPSQWITRIFYPII